MSNVPQAYRAFEEGQLAEAERICRQILSGTRADPQASWLLGHVLLRTGRVAEAQVIVGAALALSPQDADLLTVHGQALAGLGRLPEALESLLRAIDRRLLNPDAHAAVSAVLAARRDPTPRFTVSILTPTIGSPHLAQAVASVQAQTYPVVEHLIVVDGPEPLERVRAQLPRETRHPIHILPLPFNIGAGGFNGHRVYGAAPFLVNGHFVAFLDEDNWFDPEHVATLMARITSEGLAWAYALRKIVDGEGRIVTTDDCESLGQWPIWNRPDLHLVDTNCYLLRRDLAISVSALWYRRFRDDLTPDLAICQQLLGQYTNCGTNGLSTVNYRVAMTADSVGAELFLTGNAAMRERYAGGFPWRRAVN